uniref:Uncharacterized protein LOC104248545 isoform X2 n=1 Tax=Nicotiana sylvestris TaxID=4096 RepID=A0A1U7YWI7_NICSY|nr:PREDICTED: uncharacterized protein LOC104248545 isoform X2 [Nicotiana sylvestris]
MGLKYMGHYKFPEWTMLKKFVVCVRAWEGMSVLGWEHVIEAAPLLEEFELKWQLKWAKPTRSKRECRKAARCPLHHLKVLRLSGYYGRTSEVELVRYFLENAIALQKIIVDPRPQHVYYVSFSLDKSEEEQMARQFAKLQLEGLQYHIC